MNLKLKLTSTAWILSLCVALAAGAGCTKKTPRPLDLSVKDAAAGTGPQAPGTQNRTTSASRHYRMVGGFRTPTAQPQQQQPPQQPQH